MQFSVRVSLLLAAMQLLLAITVLSGTGAASPVQARDGPDLWDWLDAADYLDELDSLMLELGFGPGSGGLERIERDWDDAPQYGYQVPGSGGADLNIHGGKDPLVWGWPQRHPDAYDRRSDLAFSADELDHEYAYGLVRSLVDPSGRCLVSPDTEGPGLTEGWADFITFFFQFDKRGATRSGAFDYTIGGRPSSRPFSVNPAYNNLTYASLNEEKYRDFLDGRYMGEIWSATLFELMWELADKHNMGDLHEPTEGRRLALQIILGGMRELGKQCKGDYVAAADALLRAAELATGQDDLCPVWRARGKRGLGSGATKTPPQSQGGTRMYTASDIIPVQC